VRCTSCDTPLGAIEKGVGSNDMQMWRINKWNLRLNYQGTETAYPLECFLSSQFIAFTEEGGVRRLFITIENNGERHVHGLKVSAANSV
jgi:hypothetical protein